MARLYSESPVPLSIGLARVPWEKLRKFEITNFDITKTISSGTYGNTHLGTIKGTSDEIVIKYYSKFNDFLTHDICKELFFLNYLNQFPDTKTVKLYGYIYEDTVPPKFGLVLEKLEKTISNFTIKLGAIDVRPGMERAYKGRLKPLEYKLLFYKMLKGLSAIHSLGIVHNDIKLENIMISKTDIRFIDFGLSDYLGITPFSPNVNNYITTEIFKAPDLDSTATENYISGNRKSYGSDVYSLGVTFIDMIYKAYWIYRWTPDEILRFDNEESIKSGGDGCKDFITSRLSIDPESSSFNIPLEKGLKGFDLLHKMINPNAKERISAKDALLHPYFNDISTVESTITLDRVVRLGGAPRLFELMPITIVSEEIYRNKKFEIGYIGEIYENTKNDVITKLNRIATAKNNIIATNFFLKTLDSGGFGDEMSFTSLLCSIIFYSHSKVLKFYELTLIYSFFNNIFNYKANITRTQLVELRASILPPSKITNYVLDNWRVNSFVTIVNELDYLNLKLLYEFPDRRIIPVIEEVYIKLMVYILFSCIMMTENKLTNWEIVSTLTTYVIHRLISIPIDELLEHPIIPGLALENYRSNIELILASIGQIKSNFDLIETEHKDKLAEFLPEFFPGDIDISLLPKPGGGGRNLIKKLRFR